MDARGKEIMDGTRLQQTNLEQELVLHDPLDRLNEQVRDLQPVSQSLLQILNGVRDHLPRCCSYNICVVISY